MMVQKHEQNNLKVYYKKFRNENYTKLINTSPFVS